ncbi:RagB/SusD family nutrient uptake outer membrane protein [Mucilaginibacter sp. JRF]|uniref:RagB/SusD family nutrient uptake outer membrane protein n=1 Tax=Mucilaginibacter sp. JRF TaxID=2780088 RepID=UPI00187FEAD3|nr:RagB/SusD family nutrient uptake outer membrane protein [Mucilaginibacter sp. JRF]MBE9583234.1 RagB/SusD family nutrient uptake outer membrane protein [Mucilaginibacter sp. JRF]
MKKTIIAAAVLIFTSLSLHSCKKYLDLAPNENISEEQAFSTMIQTENFANNIYAELPVYQTRVADRFTTLDCLSDEAAPTYFQGGRTFNGGGYGPTNITNFIGHIWGNAFRNIRKCNILLEKLPSVPAIIPGDDDTRTRLRGEALFLRAFLYFDVLKVFGRVPIISQPLAPDADFKLSRNTYDECVAFIQNDLDEAVTLLPATYPSNRLGRANKAMCMALKSRLLLYAASPLNSDDNAAKWQAAATAAKNVIDLNQYSLYDLNPDKAENYKAIFNDFANKEIIWFMNLGNGKNYEQNYYPVSNGGWGDETPTQNFVDEFQMDNGKDITDPTSGYDPAQPYVNREPRFYGTVWYNGSVIRGIRIQTNPGGNAAINGGNDNTRTGYYTRKFCDESVDLYNGPGKQMMSIWFRLAEFYLNYAEASNEANASPSADPLIYSYVNIIRSRAGLPDLATGLTKEQMRLAIRHERRIELSFEEHRFFDDRRWKLTFGGQIKGIVWADAAGSSYNLITTENRAFDPKMWYMPIPQREIDITKMEQNPGWQ